MNIRNWLLITLGSAVISCVVTLYFTPHILMAGINLKAHISNGHGVLSIRPKAEAGKDDIVRMSPDLLYSACPFSLAEGAYRITSPNIGSYLSMSMFAHNSDNFFAINDQQSPQGFDIILAKKGQQIDLPTGATLVETDSPYGIILMRYYLGDKKLSTINKFRQQAKCEVFKQK